MSATTSSSSDIDAAWVAAIARQVVARLKQLDSSPNQERVVSGVVSVASIEQVGQEIQSIVVSPGVVVTPAARDAANQRGIEIHGGLAGTQSSLEPDASASRLMEQPVGHAGSSTHSHPHRNAWLSQLDRRGLRAQQVAHVLISDDPASQVWQLCQRGVRAVVVSRLADVGRFHRDLQPQRWVLDMKRLSLIEAVNVAVMIAKLPLPESILAGETP
ncbi:MAG: hypothetical protein AAGA03_02375 [Planctomycetota bacterium]